MSVLYFVVAVTHGWIIFCSFYCFSFKEVWQGRESFSDKKAREEAIESLKKMIRSWLDDTFPNMPEAERIAMSEAMDITMVEKVKEQSMRTFYEINNVIRMSFIEMQYMKKVGGTWKEDFIVVVLYEYLVYKFFFDVYRR